MVVWLLRQKRLLPFALSDANVTENMTETNLNTVVLAKATVDYINYLTAKYLQAVARTATTCDFKSEKIFVKTHLIINLFLAMQNTRKRCYERKGLDLFEDFKQNLADNVFNKFSTFFGYRSRWTKNKNRFHFHEIPHVFSPGCA